MKVRLNRLTSKENRIINHQVDLACIESAKEFELVDDICFMYAVVEELGFGKKRARRLYEKYWHLRDKVQEFVRADGEDNSLEDGLRESYMEYKLKQREIDVRQWKEEIGSQRVYANIIKEKANGTH